MLYFAKAPARAGAATLGSKVGPSFNEQFDQHGAWRRAFALQLKQLADWMASHSLMDAAVGEKLQRLEGQVRSDKVMVAFVAEFSRGKSELINAIFFADYGRRIMPASAGRTTMCPTELGYDPGVPVSLRLLPIDTRLQVQGLAEWRLKLERWVQIPLDVNDAGQMARSLEKVAEVRRVTLMRRERWASGTTTCRKKTRCRTPAAWWKFRCGAMPSSIFPIRCSSRAWSFWIRPG